MEAKKIKIEEINNSISKNQIAYVSKCENEYKRQVFEVVDNVLKNDKIKFVLLAGPSSSGKTTTSKILGDSFEKCGREVLTLSLDDFFVERIETPRWEDGEYNYETFDAIDWNLFSSCMTGLLAGKEVDLPIYNFVTGIKEFGKRTAIIKKNTIIIIEGLHALNPIIDKFIPSKNSYKVYISVNTDLFFENEPFIEHQTIRLCRRLIRDVFRSKSSYKDTKKVWQKVEIGENLYINPYVDTSNYQINSFHPYEVCVYKTIFDVLGKKDEIFEIVDKLEKLENLSKDFVPADSVLQEFMPK